MPDVSVGACDHELDFDDPAFTALLRIESDEPAKLKRIVEEDEGLHSASPGEPMQLTDRRARD